MKSQRSEDQEKRVLNGLSIGFIGEDNKIRIVIHKVLSHPKFDIVIIICIIVSSIILAIDTPSVDPAS